MEIFTRQPSMVSDSNWFDFFWQPAVSCGKLIQFHLRRVMAFHYKILRKISFSLSLSLSSISKAGKTIQQKSKCPPSGTSFIDIRCVDYQSRRKECIHHKLYSIFLFQIKSVCDCVSNVEFQQQIRGNLPLLYRIHLHWCELWDSLISLPRQGSIFWDLTPVSKIGKTMKRWFRLF